MHETNSASFIFCFCRPSKKEKKVEKGAAKEVKQEEKKKKKEKQKIDDTGRHKPYGLTAWAPIDDVYVVRHYPKPVYDADVAVDMLKSFQKLDFTPEDQPLFIELKLDMRLEKKVHNTRFKHVSWSFCYITRLGDAEWSVSGYFKIF